MDSAYRLVFDRGDLAGDFDVAAIGRGERYADQCRIREVNWRDGAARSPAPVWVPVVGSTAYSCASSGPGTPAR
jgi:hypothetical protein